MDKFVLSLELRYRKVSDDRHGSDICFPKIIVGVYDSWDEAEKVGNYFITNELSKHFEVRHDDKFCKNFAFGMKNHLVSNCCYTNGLPQYFFKISRVVIDDNIGAFVEKAIKEFEEYKLWNSSQREE